VQDKLTYVKTVPGMDLVVYVGIYVYGRVGRSCPKKPTELSGKPLPGGKIRRPTRF
jgi:hypothetical protein